MLKYLIYLFFIAFSYNNLVAQRSIRNYVKKNTVSIATIAPDSTNFRDLAPIGKAIGNARIVMLGEQGHGDAPTFLAKTRLIKYLHEKKGFDVLAFESDFFGLNKGWTNLNKTKSNIEDFITANIPGVWTGCDACYDLLYDYIPYTYTTNYPIILTGFDSQLKFGYTRSYLMPQLDSLFKQLKLPITDSPDYTTKIFPYIDTLTHLIKAPKDSIFYNTRSFYLNIVKKQLSQVLDSNSFWMMVLDNMLTDNLMLKYRFANGNYNYWKYQDIRDEQMALNLKWIAEVKYPDKKIIVWAHNYHISKYNGHYPNKWYNNAVTMGGVFTSNRILREQTFILGFTSYEGTAGRLFHQQYKLPTPPKNSLEQWINPDYQYAFVDFKQYRSEHPGNHELFYMAGSIQGDQRHTISKAAWINIFDGIFYIKRMYPCNFSRRLPSEQ